MTLIRDALEAALTLVLVLTTVVGAVLVILFIVGVARGAGWSDDERTQRWFDSGVVRVCCAKADGFLADDYDRVRPGEGGHTEGGVIAHITDNDEDPPCWGWTDNENDMTGKTCRRKVPAKRDYFVPESMIRYMPPNPTGHGVLFLSAADSPLCYFLPSGV